MLYIASALTPTAVLATLRVTGLTDNHTSLVVAKPDRVEVWDVTQTGLVFRGNMEVWGNIVGIEQVSIEGSRPHVLVLLAPPHSQLLIMTFNCSASRLILTSSLALTPPTPTLRQAEFFTAILAHERVVMVSLWIGVLSCLELECDMAQSKKKRPSNMSGMEDEGLLRLRDNFNINIREHNLLHLAFLPSLQNEHVVSFLWLTADNQLMLQIHSLSLSSHSFVSLSRPINVVTPTTSQQVAENSDFSDIPFSCPAARRVVSIPSQLRGGERTFLVIGDEFSVLYMLSSSSQPPQSTKRIPLVSEAVISPRVAARRSQDELLSGDNKRRKGISGSKMANSIFENEQLEITPLFRIRQGFGTVLSAEIMENHETGASVIMGDELGKLTAVGWEFEKTTRPGYCGKLNVLAATLGQSSPPSSLTYLDSRHIFVASAVADSALIRLPYVQSDILSQQTSNKGKGRAKEEDLDESWEVVYETKFNATQIPHSVDVLERWMNIAPVKDFCVVKDEIGATSHLILSSGASNHNSLRIVRSGVVLEDLLDIEGVSDIQNMWSLTDSSNVSRLLLTTDTTTSFIQLTPEISIIPVVDAISNMPTLAAGVALDDNGIVQDILIQVTPRGVHLWSEVTIGLSADELLVDTDTEIVCAQVNGSLVVVAKKGGDVIVLRVRGSQLHLEETIKIDQEISAVSIVQLPSLTTPLVAISTWTKRISLVSISQRATGGKASVSSDSSHATSLQLQEKGTAGRLLAGMSDGSLHVYTLEITASNSTSLNDHEQIVIKLESVSSLGCRPLTLHPCNIQLGEDKILSIALTERTHFVFENQQKIYCSGSNRKNVIAAASVLTEEGPALALHCYSTGISIVNIVSLKKLHVQTYDTGDYCINKIVNATDTNFVVCGVTQKKLMDNGDYEELNFLQLRSSTTLEVHTSLQLQERERVTALTSICRNGEDSIAAGTSILPPDNDDDSAWDEGNLAVVRRGRILLIKRIRVGQGNWTLEVESETETVGAVYDLTHFQNLLVVASGSKVSFYNDSNSRLKEIDSWTSVYVASHLLTLPPHHQHREALVVGDGMRSVSLLRFSKDQERGFEQDRKMETHGVTSMGLVMDQNLQSIVVADAHYNILTFIQRDELSDGAVFGLHEEVSCFQKGSLTNTPPQTSHIESHLLFTTRQGRIGVIGNLDSHVAQRLGELQSNMSKNWIGPGSIEWKDWRSTGKGIISRDAAGFIDGDFIRKHLINKHLYKSPQDKVIHGLSEQIKPEFSHYINELHESSDDLTKYLEEMESMH
ncbi:hypothetical protein L204_101968 [Cryptococcus depauperatus]